MENLGSIVSCSRAARVDFHYPSRPECKSYLLQRAPMKLTALSVWLDQALEHAESTKDESPFSR